MLYYVHIDMLTHFPMPCSPLQGLLATLETLFYSTGYFRLPFEHYVAAADIASQFPHWPWCHYGPLGGDLTPAGLSFAAAMHLWRSTSLVRTAGCYSDLTGICPTATWLSG